MSDSSEFEPTDLIERPELKLEDVWGEVPSCTGRGKETAAVRGYNTERLASAVFSKIRVFAIISQASHYDTFTCGKSNNFIQVECKSCVYRYPSGPYGRFRIWKDHHETLVEEAQSSNYEMTSYLYFFVVYTVEDGEEREVGKLVVPVEAVDEVLESWSHRDHTTMGERSVRDISWHLLLQKLGVPERALVEYPVVDLTDGVPEGAEES